MIIVKEAALTEGDAPLVSALKAFLERDATCFHFPNIIEAKLLISQLTGEEMFSLDLTPLPITADFFSPEGVILEAQK